ncbi:MAG: leucine-rich repeat domain-containing protein [Bacilli bacterium]|nr:leucine-rich repeat domain-containing protein [Bacilli bacterium]
MKNKKTKLANSNLGGGQLNKAFTLIELLAIIVILAIIAVITIPIILNIVDNSSKGAAVDSAYGYKNAVNDFYVQELYEDPNFKLDGGYNVKDGRLNGLDILFSGTKPTNGTLIYENNVLKDGCLAIDGYKITIEDGEVTDTTKGTCEDVSLTSCTSPYFHPSPVEWFKFDTSDPTMLIGFQEKDDEHPNGWDGATEITIPCKNPDGQDITSISNGAFVGANVITSVVIPDTVTLISNGAFRYNPIKSLILGQNVEKILNGAFNMNQEDACSLKTLTLPGSLKIITHGFLWYCTIENLVFEGDVEEISYSAFYNSSIENIIFNGRVGTIRSVAFAGHKMKSVILPGELETFGYEAFAGEYLEEITFPKNTGDIVDFGDAEEYPNLRTIYNNTGKAYDWNKILGNTSSTPFITGTVTRSDGSIVNILESN